MSRIEGLYEDARRVLRSAVGVVIPVCIPKSADAAHARALIGDTAAAYCGLLAEPSAVCLSVDGNPAGAALARALKRKLGCRVVIGRENHGKFAAVRSGMCELLDHGRHAYLAVVDQDGDHFANELINLLRAGRHAEAEARTKGVLVIGHRRSRHHPMGLGRGELEELADRMLLDALQYHAVVSQRPLGLEYAGLHGEFPDFHSGFKLFSRAIAMAVFTPAPSLCGLPAESCVRHAVEAVMTVEALMAGASLVLVERTAINEQPITVFGQLNRARLTADMILWPCRRLAIPAPFVDQWMRNHIARLLLYTLVPEGRQELENVWRLVMAGSATAGVPFKSDLSVPPFL